MNLIAILNNSIVKVVTTEEKYKVHWLQKAKMFEFENIEMHSKEPGELCNTSKDKIKTMEEVTSLLRKGKIKIIKKQSLQTTVIKQIDL